MDPIQITVNHTAFGATVNVGSIVLDKYMLFRTMEQFLAAAELTQDVHKRRVELMKSSQFASNYAASYAMAQNKAIYEITRTSKQKFLNLVNGKMREAFIKHIPEDILNHHCFSVGGNPSSVKVNAVNDTLPILKEAYKDGIQNITPLLIAFKSSPKALKERFGKGTWKTLCKNSLSRNKLIASYILRTSNNRRLVHSPDDVVKLAIKVPSTLLSYTLDINALLFIANAMRGEWHDSRKVQAISIKYLDTCRMLRHAGESDDNVINWSLRRLDEEHARLTKAVRSSKLSPEIFDWAGSLPFGPFCYSGYEVYPLLSAKDIADEGIVMGHCVGSYAFKSRSNSYLVCSVRKDGTNYSTIGFDVYHDTGKPQAYLQQHYKQYNKSLDDSDPAVDIPNLISSLF